MKMEVNYKKKYEEALKWIRELYPTMVSCADKEAALRHFPELAESDDERIRKEMLDFFKGFYGNSMIKSVDVGPWIAWLEKQCKQKPQSQWKPSAEQMKFLWRYAEQNNYDGSILTSLYNDLKKLRQE